MPTFECLCCGVVAKQDDATSRYYCAECSKVRCYEIDPGDENTPCRSYGR